ncbi:hypothetical protein BASA83_006624 [Batrachochytrium salamandrivorans]|nr:hypothetical protein BASA83_006624 [Batrachochytrium salamandrivorans]
MQAVFPTLSLATFERKCRRPHPYQAVRDIRWISRQVVQLLVDADYGVGFHTDNYQSGRDYRKSFKAWVLAPKQQTRISSLLSRRLLHKTVTTISAVLTSKQRNFFRSLLASIGARPRGSHC